jgi:hypothetical protein
VLQVREAFVGYDKGTQHGQGPAVCQASSFPQGTQDLFGGPQLRSASSPTSGFFSNRQAGSGTLTTICDAPGLRHSPGPCR